MGIFRMLNQWREKSDGTLTGPALEAEESNIKNIAYSVQNKDQISRISGRAVSVDGTSFYPVFDFADAVDILSFVVSGPIVREIRITWEDDSTTTTGARAPMRTDGTDEAVTVKTLGNTLGVKKLEFENDAGGSQKHGFEVRFV